MDQLILTDQELETALSCIRDLLGMHISADYDAEALADKIEDYLATKED